MSVSLSLPLSPHISPLLLSFPLSLAPSSLSPPMVEGGVDQLPAAVAHLTVAPPRQRSEAGVRRLRTQMSAGTRGEHVHVLTIMRRRGTRALGLLPLLVRQRCLLESQKCLHDGRCGDTPGLSPCDSHSERLLTFVLVEAGQRGGFITGSLR